jgi:hypothetical protein
MPLSEKGALQIQQIAKKHKIKITVIQEQTPIHATRSTISGFILHSNRLISQGATRHFPTLFFYKNHQLQSQSIPGYQTEDAVVKTFKEKGLIQ